MSNKTRYIDLQHPDPSHLTRKNTTKNTPRSPATIIQLEDAVGYHFPGVAATGEGKEKGGVWQRRKIRAVWGQSRFSRRRVRVAERS
ncbi:hypothetical protein E2C01_027891 [Portunus trituberculatus]|uniref:Uncharacterized protein n=1 Tax=Portunus trituberculatus TaxID=210409 RepID=A0A5B7EMV4_PORTR|nr:hypothetical protein [Portunus trituberculatus]